MRIDESFDFSGKVAVVTGGMRGIGRTIADSLCAQGAEVHAFDWGEPEEGEDLGGIVYHKVDVSNSESVDSAVASIGKPVSMLVNNAGITKDRSLGKMSDDEWEAVININLSGAFYVLRAISKGMATERYGRIVNITSINGIRGKFGQANYTAAKGGMIALTKTAAKELGPKGVTVNAVAPGMVMTEMAKKLPQQYLDNALTETATKVLADPEDIANGVIFLLSDAARCVTGQILQVDSGQYI
ncbi:MAG: SDR family oxidoreductase [Rhodospirillales bacterium]|nr:SDR family oxidoreductase [Rhodospirillales bacterium]